MRVDLTCPYADSAKVKALGAKWDPARKTWYAENVPDMTPFMPWVARASHKAPVRAPERRNPRAARS